jgi:penicillin-binding protein 1A
VLKGGTPATSKEGSMALERKTDQRRVLRDFEGILEANGYSLAEELKPERRRTPLRGQRPSWWFSRVVILTVALAVLATAAVILAPLPYDPPIPLQTVHVFDQHDRFVARISAEERRVVVPIARIPERVRQAFLAAEDERFFQHEGVDGIAILRALWENVTGGRFQGGSTITQQLVRNTADPYVGRERTLTRKIREALMALRLERSFSKEQILEMYLNQIYFGEGVYGIETAAREYFGVHVWNLDLGQAATLAGVVAGPSRYNPRQEPEAARGRRDWVLSRMLEVGFITPEESRDARRAPIVVVPHQPQESRAAYFVDWLTRDLRRRLGADVLYRGGLRVESTIDLRLQRAAEHAIATALDEPGDPDAALVAIDVRTGAIRAMVGGRDFNTSQVNLATGQGGSGRQAGSAFKPFVLARALQEGISTGSVYPAPSSVTIDGHSFSNFGGASYGSLTLGSATVSSVNTVYAQLIEDVGAEDVVRLAHRMGIRSDLPEVPSLALGTGEVTPLEMTAAYATLASGGTYRRPTGVERIVDYRGEVIEELDPTGRRALPEATADAVTGVLLDVVSAGTATAAQLPGVAVAGKTGTAEDHADAWFCGYTSSIATCVWVGHKEGRIPMSSVQGIAGVTGGSLPAQIWRAFMSTLPAPERGLAPAAGITGGSSSSGGAATGGGGGGSGPPGDGPAEEPPAPPAPPPAAPPPEDPGGDIVPPDILPPG